MKKWLVARVAITEEEIWEALKKVGKDKTLGIDGLPYKVHTRLRLSPMLVPYSTQWLICIKGTIFRRFTIGVVNLLRKKKHGRGMGLVIFGP